MLKLPTLNRLLFLKMQAMHVQTTRLIILPDEGLTGTLVRVNDRMLRSLYTMLISF